MAAIFSEPYLICGLTGALLAAIMLFIIGQRIPHVKGELVVCYAFAFVFMLIGAHLLFFIVNLPDFRANYGDSIYDIQSFLVAVFNASSGMVFYGGLFGAIFGVWLFTRITKGSFRSYMNAAACTFPLMHACGRIGCTLDGCCYGIEYHGIFAIQYTEEHITPGISDHIADFPRFPVQPMEAALELLICIMLVIIYLKKGDKYPIIAIYLFSYGIVRFLDEFLRGDKVRGIWGPFSTSQWIALICVISVIIYYLRQVLKGRQTAQE